LLPRGGVRLFAQPLQVWNQLAIDEPEERAQRAVLQLLAFRTAGRGPVMPAIRRFQRRRELRIHRLGFLRLAGLAFIKNAKEQNPRQLGNVLKRASTVRAPHDVADALDRAVDRLLRGVALAVSVFWL